MLQNWYLVDDFVIATLLELMYSKNVENGIVSIKFKYEPPFTDCFYFPSQALPQLVVEEHRANNSYISLKKKDRKYLDQFFRNYLEKYRRHELIDQGDKPTAKYLTEQLLARINSPEYVKTHDIHNILIKTSVDQLDHHTILDLFYQNKIEIVSYEHDQDDNYHIAWFPIINNYSLLPKPIQLPDDVNWVKTPERYDLVFSNGKKLVFKHPEAVVAKYFAYLIDRHGLPVKKAETSDVLHIDKSKLRNAAKTINRKIKDVKLSKDITLKSSEAGTNTLIVT